MLHLCVRAQKSGNNFEGATKVAAHEEHDTTQVCLFSESNISCIYNALRRADMSRVWEYTCTHQKGKHASCRQLRARPSVAFVVGEGAREKGEGRGSPIASYETARASGSTGARSKMRLSFSGRGSIIERNHPNEEVGKNLEISRIKR